MLLRSDYPVRLPAQFLTPAMEAGDKPLVRMHPNPSGYGRDRGLERVHVYHRQRRRRTYGATRCPASKSIEFVPGLLLTSGIVHPDFFHVSFRDPDQVDQIKDSD
ncbi:hypothetical protein SAMN02799616_00204 [Paenibacillus sp. UNC499MF]|nr:hypothetical protein SAMN02799616_00204 [Paenibacillus sp. UNC499MF]